MKSTKKHQNKMENIESQFCVDQIFLTTGLPFKGHNYKTGVISRPY